MFLRIMGTPRVFRMIGNSVVVPYHTHSYHYNLVPCSMPTEGKCPACDKFKEMEEKKSKQTGANERASLKSQSKYYSILNRYYYNVWAAQLVDPPEDRRFIDEPTSDLNNRLFEVLWVMEDFQKMVNCKINNAWKNKHYKEDYTNWLFNPVDKNPERIAFIKGILADQTDKTSKLVFADWLDDHDDPHRAEGLRILVKTEGLKKKLCSKKVIEHFVELRNKTLELNPFDVWDGVDFTAHSRRDERENFYKEFYEGEYIPYSSKPIATIEEIVSGLKMFNIGNFAKQGNSKQVQKSMENN